MLDAYVGHNTHFFNIMYGNVLLLFMKKINKKFLYKKGRLLLVLHCLMTLYHGMEVFDSSIKRLKPL